MTNPTPHGQVPEALEDFEVRKLAAIGAVRTSSGLVERRPIEYRRELEDQFVRGFRAAEKRLSALSAAPTITPETGNSASAKGAAITSESGTPPAEQQAAPKAAPTRTALPEGWTDCTIEFGNDGPEVVAYGPKRMMTRLAKWLGKYFAQVIADAATKAAPQQEAQEPALFVSAKQLAALTDPDDPDGEHGRYLPVRKTTKGLFTQALYTAPQPAPAPLSEREAFEAWIEKDGGDLGTFGTPPNMHYRNSSVNNAWVAWKARAALAAQGGK